MNTRTELLNFLAHRYQLERYLEIGVQKAANNYDKIICSAKVSVDPDPLSDARFLKTSDEFFREWISLLRPDGETLLYPPGSNPEPILPFDLVFIDGLHHADQVQKDFFNAAKLLSPKGFIVLHDCNPPEERFTHVPRDSKVWYGDVYKFASQFAGQPYFNTIDIDCGCGVFKNADLQNVDNTFVNIGMKQITWDEFDKDRKTLLNLVSAEEFVKAPLLK